jgi:hypothetical protein
MEAAMGDSQRLSDNEQLEILALLETVSTERSAIGAARSTPWGNASPVSCPNRIATSGQPGASAIARFVGTTSFAVKAGPERSRA